MKIDAVDLYYLKMPTVTNEVDGSQDALLIRVRAGDCEGWGESESSPLTSIAAWCTPKSHGACRPVNEVVLGQTLDTPRDIERINREVREQCLDLLQADHLLSGIDIALWDLLAKKRGVPVHQLLGLRSAHAKLPYASVLFGDAPEETFAKAERIRKQGFRAAKFGWNRFGRGAVSVDIEHVAAAKEGMGPDGYVMVDAGTVWVDSIDAARERLPGLHALGITWLEEPFVSGALDAYAGLSTDAAAVPLAAGEGAHRYHMAKQLIDFGNIRYVQIDTGRIGGITTARQVAQYAKSRGVQFVNHTFTSMLALSASLAPYWDLEDSRFCEYPVETKPLCTELTIERILPDENGLIQPIDRPGLGVTPDPQAIRRYLVDVDIRIDGEVVYRTPDPDHI